MENTFLGKERMAYETPAGGITITGYIVRRMHKTRILEGIENLFADDPLQALEKFGVYALAASTSFGPAMYQPSFDRPGSVISLPDPDTGMAVTVRQLPRDPHYKFAYEVELPQGSKISGEEVITGTTVGLRGLGMPAPSKYFLNNATDSYRAEAIGIINSELAPGLGRWRIRGYGELKVRDNIGNQGVLALSRNGNIKGELISSSGNLKKIAFQI